MSGILEASCGSSTHGPKSEGGSSSRLCRWYLRNAPEYRRRFREVWLWKDWPEAWAADAGIDLVAEERDGSLWAVQAKAYGESYAIKKADVDSFLSESSRPALLVSPSHSDHRPDRRYRTTHARRPERCRSVISFAPSLNWLRSSGRHRSTAFALAVPNRRSRFRMSARRSEQRSRASTGRSAVS